MTRADLIKALDRLKEYTRDKIVLNCPLPPE